VIAISAGSDFSLALVGDGPPIQKAKLTALKYDAGGFEATILSQSGRVFALERAPTVNSQNWTSFPLVAGNGHSVLLKDSTATNSATRIYRVRRW
jgi:hypothetical protein